MLDPPSPSHSFGLIQLKAAAVYEYEPLPGMNYIRHVKLRPGTFEEAILISLDVVPFSQDHRTEYEALLYVWGLPEQPENVRVYETYGLTALMYLRRKNEPRTLWIDAPCVNQIDDVEKCPQVAMMGDISTCYSGRSLAWSRQWSIWAARSSWTLMET